MWMQRPSSDVILDAAVKNVAFLLELRIALLERMLSRFVDGVDVYLSVIRDTSKQQYGEVSLKLQSLNVFIIKLCYITYICSNKLYILT